MAKLTQSEIDKILSSHSCLYSIEIDGDESIKGLSINELDNPVNNSITIGKPEPSNNNCFDPVDWLTTCHHAYYVMIIFLLILLIANNFHDIISFIS